MIRRSLILSLGILSIGSVGAMAADWIPPAPHILSGPYNWTGFYVGGHVGYGWGPSHNTTISWSDPGDLAGSADAVAAGVIPLTLSPYANGAVGGAQIGYNWQFSPDFLVGAETDFSFADLNGSQTVSTAVSGYFPMNESVSQKLDWFGTIRGRFGVIAENWMLYGTGGGAYGHVNYTYALSNTPTGTVDISGTDSATQWGWTIGGGIEYNYDRWLLRVEYLYMDFGDHSFTVPLTTVPTATFTANFGNNYQLVRMGINYRF
jgi:outer membrane immunogenic protein